MSAPACWPRCSPGRSTRRWGRSGTSRASSCASARQRPWIAPVDRLGRTRTTTSWCWSPTRTTWRRSRDDLRLFISAVARGARAAREDPAGAARHLIDANKDLRPRTTRAQRAAHDSGAVSRAARPAVRLPRPGEVAELRRLDGRQRLARKNARRERGAHERAAAGRRALARRAPVAVRRAPACLTRLSTEQVHVHEERARSHDRAAQLTPAAAADPRPSPSADGAREGDHHGAGRDPACATATGPPGQRQREQQPAARLERRHRPGDRDGSVLQLPVGTGGGHRRRSLEAAAAVGSDHSARPSTVSHAFASSAPASPSSSLSKIR